MEGIQSFGKMRAVKNWQHKIAYIDFKIVYQAGLKL